MFHDSGLDLKVVWGIFQGSGKSMRQSISQIIFSRMAILRTDMLITYYLLWLRVLENQAWGNAQNALTCWH